MKAVIQGNDRKAETRDVPLTSRSTMSPDHHEQGYRLLTHRLPTPRSWRIARHVRSRALPASWSPDGRTAVEARHFRYSQPSQFARLASPAKNHDRSQRQQISGQLRAITMTRKHLPPRLANGSCRFDLAQRRPARRLVEEVGRSRGKSPDAARRTFCWFPTGKVGDDLPACRCD